MNFKKWVLIVIPLLIVLLLSISFNKKMLMDYQFYDFDQINVSNETILMEGGVVGASGIGFDGFDYSIEQDAIFLKIYQQSLFPSKPLDGHIQIKLDGDFSTIKAIYLVQAKVEPIKIWPQKESLQS
jgi:hypothetical protein